MATLVSDNFNRADSDALGANWTERGSNNFQIVSNRIQCTSTPDRGVAHWSSTTPFTTANYEVAGTIYPVSGGDYDVGLLGRRVNYSTDQSNCYALYYHQSGSFVYLRKNISGVGSIIGSFGKTITAGTGYPAKLSMNGTTIKVYDNVTEIISVTDSSLSAAGDAGIGDVSGAGPSGGSVDDFIVTDFSAAGHTVAVNQISETDTAQALTKRKQKTLGQNVEAELAQAVTRKKIRALGQISEADTAQALTRKKRKAIGQTTEADLAHPLTAKKTKGLGQVTETDLAQPIARAGGLSAAVNQVTETDTALAIAWSPKRRRVNQISEADLARALTPRKLKALTQPSEADLAQPITARKAKTLGQPVETELAQAFTHRKLKILGPVTETDLAQPVSVPGSIIVPVNQVVETDLAQPITWAPKKRLVNRVIETDLAQPLTARKIRTLGILIETDLAQALTKRKMKGIAPTVEIDLAQGILWSPKRRLLGQVVEVDLAQPITVDVGEKVVNIIAVTLHVQGAVSRVLAVTTVAGVRVRVARSVERTILI